MYHVEGKWNMVGNQYPEQQDSFETTKISHPIQNVIQLLLLAAFEQFHMSSESDEHFDVEDQSPGHPDVYRLEYLLRNARDSKRHSDKKSLASVKDAIHLEEQKNLEARLEMTENQLAKAKENTLLLMEKLGEAETQIEELRGVLEHERSNKRQDIDTDTHQVRRSPQEEEEQQGQYQQMLEEIEKLQRLCDEKDHENERLAMRVKSMGVDGQQWEYDLKRLEEEKDQMERELRLVEKKLNSKYLEDQSKGVEILESQQLSNAVERLLQLLRSTQQYKHFTLFSEDAKGLHFMKNMPKKLKNSTLLSVPPKKVKLCSCMELKVDERLLWTPEHAYKAMQEIKSKHEYLNEECIEEIMFSLNQIWLAREECHLKRVKESFQNQIRRLKKRNEQRYDEVVARKQIQRLKKEVSKARNKSEKGLVKVETMKVAGQYQDQLRLKQKEVKLLQEKVKLMESESNSYDKIIYMQGALWIIEKVLVELESYNDHLKQFEENFIEEMNNTSSVGGNSRVNKSYKLFFERLGELQESLYQKVVLMHDSTLKKLQGRKTLSQKETL